MIEEKVCSFFDLEFSLYRLIQISIECFEAFKVNYKSTPHFRTCYEIFSKFQALYPDKKLLIDWRDYIREINMEDAIHADSSTVIVSTMHKSKGKEFDHVWMLVDRYQTFSDESKRLLYVACSRAKASLSIHTNIDFFDGISALELERKIYQGELHAPNHYELILSHKEINLNSQKYPRALGIISGLSTGDQLQGDRLMFGNNEASGLALKGKGNMLLFSKRFVQKKLSSFKSNGYKLVSARVEYLVYWYDKDEDKEYQVVLPRLRFEQDK